MISPYVNFWTLTGGVGCGEGTKFWCGRGTNFGYLDWGYITAYAQQDSL